MRTIDEEVAMGNSRGPGVRTPSSEADVEALADQLENGDLDPEEYFDAIDRRASRVIDSQANTVRTLFRRVRVS